MNLVCERVHDYSSGTRDSRATLKRKNPEQTAKLELYAGNHRKRGSGSVKTLVRNLGFSTPEMIKMLQRRDNMVMKVRNCGRGKWLRGMMTHVHPMKLRAGKRRDRMGIFLILRPAMRLGSWRANDYRGLEVPAGSSKRLLEYEGSSGTVDQAYPRMAGLSESSSAFSSPYRSSSGVDRPN